MSRQTTGNYFSRRLKKKTFHFERLRVPIEVDLPYFHNFFTPIIPFRCNSSGKIDPNSLLLEHNQDVCSLIRACRMSMRRTFCLYIGFAHLHDYYLVDDLILHYLCVNAHEWILREIFKEATYRSDRKNLPFSCWTQVFVKGSSSTKRPNVRFAAKAKRPWMRKGKSLALL